MKSLNRLTLIGNVGNDPEIRSTTGGKRVATISVATTQQWGKADARQEKTEWHRVVLWEGLADVAEKYVHKGDRIYIEGRVDYRKWEDRDGATRYTTECVANEVILLGSRDRQQARSNEPPPPDDDFDHDDGRPGEGAGDYFDRKAEEGRAKRGGGTRGSGTTRATGKRASKRR